MQQAMHEDRDKDQRVGVFPTFFLTGFECSTFLWKDGERKDYVALTGHDAHLEEDYQKIRDLGIAVVREAIRWPLVDRGGGRYDWSTVDAVLDCLEACDLTPIWDLCHYGFPDDMGDPFADDAVRRFADYCRAAAERVVPRTKGPRFFTPVNEITFFAGGGTDMGWMWPFAKGRYAEFKRTLCRMAIAGVNAIREVDPDARMVHVDPVVHTVPPPDRPDLADEAWADAYEKAFEAWDMLAGRLAPELGGSPEVLDIVGVNVYHFSQAEMKPDGSREVLGPRDPRRKPLSEMLEYAWERYKRPLIIGETSGFEDKRDNWLRMTMEESMKALNAGVDLQGVCLFPFIDMPDWNSGKPACIGVYERADDGGRVPCQPYIDELRKWEHLLEHPEHSDAVVNSSDDGVQLSEVKRLARAWCEKLKKADTRI
jgi:hypothetical protein